MRLANVSLAAIPIYEEVRMSYFDGGPYAQPKGLHTLKSR